MRFARFLLIPFVLAIASCSTVREGVIVQKRCRYGLPNVYATSFSFRYDEPDVYWVNVQGRDDRGRVHCREVILFRHDWEQLRVGDHWSSGHGFSPAEAYQK